jgi:hypothetical protein
MARSEAKVTRSESELTDTVPLGLSRLLLCSYRSEAPGNEHRLAPTLPSARSCVARRCAACGLFESGPRARSGPGSGYDGARAIRAHCRGARACKRRSRHGRQTDECGVGGGLRGTRDDLSRSAPRTGRRRPPIPTRGSWRPTTNAGTTSSGNFITTRAGQKRHCKLSRPHWRATARMFRFFTRSAMPTEARRLR